MPDKKIAAEKVVTEKITRATVKLFIDAGEAALKEFTLKITAARFNYSWTNSKNFDY